jgi:hypothetical protein
MAPARGETAGALVRFQQAPPLKPSRRSGGYFRLLGVFEELQAFIGGHNFSFKFNSNENSFFE